MANFPAIKPSSRSYSPGNYPIREYQALSGTKWKRIMGNRRFGMKLELEFQNIDDSTAAQVLQHYDGEAGTFKRFALPASVFAGMDSGLQAQLTPPTNVLWAYADAPSVQSVFPGVSTVSVKLVGEIDYEP